MILHKDILVGRSYSWISDPKETREVLYKTLKTLFIRTKDGHELTFNQKDYSWNLLPQTKKFWAVYPDPGGNKWSCPGIYQAFPDHLAGFSKYEIKEMEFEVNE